MMTIPPTTRTPPVRPHGQDRRAQFREMVEHDAGLQPGARQEVEPAAERIGQRLGLEKVREDREVAPSRRRPGA